MSYLKFKVRQALEARLKKANCHLKPIASNFKQSPFDKSLSITVKCEEPITVKIEDTKPVTTQVKRVPLSVIMSEENQPKKRRRTTTKTQKKEATQCTKNIAINYGKAIASFASSEMALPYLENIVQNEGITLAEFVDFIRLAKENIGGIDSFRYLLLPTDKDDAKTAALKSTLRQIGVIFVKYFSVNWICHGRVTHKLIYLKYRGKILRRIQKPEFFTYIKEHKKKK